ncbi:MAG: hypothetical protein GXZ07_08585 [Firmicutes bacterium]|nr:hypothetical protein [Bacillota bacterium]
MGLRKDCIILLLLVLMLIMAGCAGERKSEEKQEQKEVPPAIKEIEGVLLSIMQQADLIPATEKLSGQSQTNSGSKEGNQEKGKPVKELTYEDTLLGELLKAEGFEVEEQKLPQSTDIIWDGINKSIARLYSQWNDLEPLLKESESVSQAEIAQFEEGLDNLTVFSSEQNYFATMTAANQLTGNLANLMASFADNKVIPLYKLKFHLRSIVLQAATDDYSGAQESLDYIKGQKPVLTQSLDENELRALELSLEDLQRVLDKQNLELVILNASIVMGNTARVIEKSSFS